MLVVVAVGSRYTLRWFGFFFRDCFSKKQQLGQAELGLGGARGTWKLHIFCELEWQKGDDVPGADGGLGCQNERGRVKMS